MARLAAAVHEQHRPGVVVTPDVPDEVNPLEPLEPHEPWLHRSPLAQNVGSCRTSLYLWRDRRPARFPEDASRRGSRQEGGANRGILTPTIPRLYRPDRRLPVKASIKQKTYNLDSGVIDTVRRLFEAKTDTEAIQRALRKAIDDREVASGRQGGAESGLGGPKLR